MRTKLCTALLAISITVTVTACTTEQASNPNRQEVSSATAVSPSPEASPTIEARGIAESVTPHWIQTQEGELAANFVRIANTPDARLDGGKPIHAWRRAIPYCHSELAEEIQHQKDFFGDQLWTEQIVPNDGYASVEILNILGETPHDAGPQSQEPEQVREVIFRQIYHQPGKDPVYQKNERWIVTVVDGKIKDFNTEIEEP